MKNLHTRKTSNGSNSDWLIRQMSINQKSGRQTFRRRFASGSLFVSPGPPECNFQSETKIERYLRLEGFDINHRNNCKSDNRFKNLQILTDKENVDKSRNN